MLYRYLFFPILFLAPSFSSGQSAGAWVTEKHRGYTLGYRSAGRADKKRCNQLIARSIRSVHRFFGASYPEPFSVVVHPDRHSLDSTWRKDWNMPDFKSECWMVASGVGSKLDILSPKRWRTEACEHDDADALKTQQLITHELVHVFHGQHNSSPDFSEVSGLDWFVEGLATYASGQCDSARLAAVKKAVAGNSVPAALDGFWSGPLKYGLSGSLVLYIDRKYGREKLKSLLAFTRKADLLQALGVSEAELLEGWKRFIPELKPIE